VPVLEGANKYASEEVGIHCMKYLTLLLVLSTEDCMAELFKDECHPVSGRCVILEDNGNSAWLYLTPKSGEGIEKVAFAYSPIEPTDELNKEEIAKGNPPVLYKKLASLDAVIDSAKEVDFTFKWSSNGESITLLYKDKPIAMIHEEYQRGFSIALSEQSGFGEPWNQKVYSSEFE